MTERHTLPSGGWVELRDPADLKAKDRKRVMRAMGDPTEGNIMSASVDMADGVLATMITAWEVPYLPGAPIPANQPDILDELTLPDENELQRLTADAAKLFRPVSTDPSDYTAADGTPNVDSPSGPASA